MFSAVGFLLFAINDLAVDIIYFGRRLWRSATIYRRYPKTFGKALANGFPVAALVGRRDLMGYLADGRVLHGGTYNTQSVAMAATSVRGVRSSRPCRWDLRLAGRLATNSS